MFNKYIFLFISRYVRTDSWFWDFSWELCDTSLTSHLLPATTTNGTLTLPQQTLFFLLLQFQHSSISFTPHNPPSGLDLHVFTAFNSWNGSEDRNTEWSLTSYPLHVCTVHVCVRVFHSYLRVFTHTICEGRMNADDTVLNAKKGLSCSSTICCCREFAFPHTKQLCSSYESIKLLSTGLDHHSAMTKHNILF